LESTPFIPQQARGGVHLTIDQYLRCPRSTHSELRYVLTEREPGRGLLYQEDGRAAGAPREDHVEVGFSGVRDEHFAALQPEHSCLSLRLGGGGERPCIGTRRWFGEAEGCELTAGEEVRKPFCFLFFAAEALDAHGDRVVDR